MRICKIIKNNKLNFLVALIFSIFASCNTFAATCSTQYNNNNISQNCSETPSVDSQCLDESNKSNNQACINIMPVASVSSVSDDVCYNEKKQSNHEGMDYDAALGTSVTAAMDGIIFRYSFGAQEPSANNCQSGYGNVVEIKHEGCNGKTYSTRYAHLTNKPVLGLKTGVKVKKGDVIGYVGGTGSACGKPHLHFEIRDAAGSLINPICDEIQKLCNCQTPTKSNVESCKKPSSSPENSTNVEGQVTTVNMGETNKAEEGDSDGCPTFEKVRNDYRSWGCIFCKPFQIIYNTASVMAKVSFNALAKPVFVVVMVGMALWLALIVLRYVSNMEAQEPRTFINEIVKQMFRVLIVAVLLNSSLPQILSLSVDPVFNTGLKIAQSAGKISDTCNLGDNLSIIDSEKGGLSQSMGTGILCTVKSIQNQIVDVLALGEISWCLAWEDRSFGFIPNLGYTFTCILFFLAGFLLLVIYPYLLVDCVLKLAIAVALLPAALGAFAFKITGQYLEKVWEIFLNAIFCFIFLSLIIFIITSVAADALRDMTSQKFVFAPLWWSYQVIKLLAICFLGWAVLGEMKKFADSFAGGLKFKGQGIGSPTGSTVMAATKWAGTKAGKPILRGGKNLVIRGGQYIQQSYYHASIAKWNGAAKGKFTNIGSLFKGNLTEAVDTQGNTLKDANGNTLYQTTGRLQKLLGRKEYRSFETDVNGNTKMNIFVEKRNGKRKEKTVDAYGRTIRKYDKNGILVKNKIKANSVALKHIMNKDGTFDEKTLNDFMQNSNLTQNEKQTLLMKTIFNKRMNKIGDKLSDGVIDRQITQGTDKIGRTIWMITQKYSDGSVATFKLTFGNDARVMSEYQNVDKNGSGTAYATDGIIQRKSYIKTKKKADGSTDVQMSSRYAFSDFYSKYTNRPLYSDGTFSKNIPVDEIMFDQNDISNFARQVTIDGNKAFRFHEFK